MKNISALAAFAAFTMLAMICGVTVAAPAGPGTTVEPITAAILIPVAQDLPVSLASN